MIQKLYHLTDPANVESILRDGIIGDSIFCFTDMLVANAIAREQMFLLRYAVFSIDPKGIVGQVLPDDVGEFTKLYHRIIAQDRIDPRYVTLVGIYDTTDKPTEWDYLQWGHLGKTREWVDARYYFNRATSDRPLCDISEKEEAEILRQAQKICPNFQMRIVRDCGQKYRLN